MLNLLFGEFILHSELCAGFELLSQALGSRKDSSGMVMMAVVLADTENN